MSPSSPDGDATVNQSARNTYQHAKYPAWRGRVIATININLRVPVVRYAAFPLEVYRWKLIAAGQQDPSQDGHGQKLDQTPARTKRALATVVLYFKPLRQASPRLEPCQSARSGNP